MKMIIHNTFSDEQLNRMVKYCFEAEEALIRGNFKTRWVALHNLAWVTDTLNKLVPPSKQKYAR